MTWLYETHLQFLREEHRDLTKQVESLTRMINTQTISSTPEMRRLKLQLLQSLQAVVEQQIKMTEALKAKDVDPSK